MIVDFLVRRHKRLHPDWDPGVVGDTTKEPWQSAHLMFLPRVAEYLFTQDTKREPSKEELKASIPKYTKAARNLMKTMLSAPMTLEKAKRDKQLEEVVHEEHAKSAGQLSDAHACI